MNNYSIKFTFIAFLIVSIYACGSINNGYSNYSYNPKPRKYSGTPEHGKPSGPGCFAKCLIVDEYSYSYQDIFEYTGSDFNDPVVEEKTIEIEPASAEWVKKKADPNCLSQDPDDCLVWCLLDNEAKYKSYYIVTDTTHVKEYKISSIETKSLFKKGGFTQWKEIVCANQQSPEFYKNIQHALRQNNFDLINAKPGVFDKITKNALIKYQTDNSLPVGSLDIETMLALGVE